MAEIQAFRAFRYDLGRVGALSDVVCPPYDVIDQALQKNLYDRNPHNMIRLELNREEAGDNDSHNRYSRAAVFLRDWINKGALVQDSARSLYVLHQEYEVEGQRHTRKGFFARVRLEPFGQGSIYAHEETMSGPKADRLKLLHATGMNLSPIFGLFPDAQAEVQAILDAAIHRQLPREATDHLGVVSRLWPVTDQSVISRVIGLMGAKPIFIADGHHRYETGLRYLQDKRDAGEVPNADAAANFILMALVGMSDPGLLILPTHRLVRGTGSMNADRLRSVLHEHFQLETIGKGASAMRETWERIQIDGSQNVLGFGTVEDGVWQLGTFHSPALMQQLAADHSPDWRSLAVSILHVVVLDKLLKAAAGVQPECRYVHRLSEMQDAISTRDHQLSVLVPPATMGHVERIAGNLEKMPPKSTYFYPKLLSGLVMHSVKGN